MDPYFQSLVSNLAELAARNTASFISDRISSLKASKRDAATIVALEEIINDLIADKTEAIRIASAYEQELVAQRISDSDITFITETVVPIVEQLVSESEMDEEKGGDAQSMLEILKQLLSPNTINVLQLVGFNFKQAIGEPLTKLVASKIEGPAQSQEINADVQRLQLENQTELLRLSQDAEAVERFDRLIGR